MEAMVRGQFDHLRRFLNERRRWAANEAVSLGYGGASTVKHCALTQIWATGVSRRATHARLLERRAGDDQGPHGRGNGRE